MVESEGVSIRVVRHSDGIPYAEYLPPSTSTMDSERSKERYIEVSNDERYCVEVKLLPEFQFFGHAGVRMKFDMDGEIHAKHNLMDWQADPVCEHPVGHNRHKNVLYEFVLSTVS
jgi:hypothetical protein